METIEPSRVARKLLIADIIGNLQTDHHFQFAQMRKLKFSLFQAVDSSVWMIRHLKQEEAV